MRVFAREQRMSERGDVFMCVQDVYIKKCV